MTTDTGRLDQIRWALDNGQHVFSGEARWLLDQYENAARLLDEAVLVLADRAATNQQAAELAEQRDRARRWAVHLEQELAETQRRLDGSEQEFEAIFEHADAAQQRQEDRWVQAVRLGAEQKRRADRAEAALQHEQAKTAAGLRICDLTESRELHADAWIIAKEIRAALDSQPAPSAQVDAVLDTPAARDHIAGAEERRSEPARPDDIDALRAKATGGVKPGDPDE